MFDLETQVTDWRNQMLAAGIADPRVLDELEEHLREEMEAQLQAGLSEPAAYDAAARRVGRAKVLKTEFAWAGETIFERLKQLFRASAGIPNYQLATNMNTSNSNLESGWATYLKSAALIVPAVFIWVGSCCFVVPKLKEICEQSSTHLPPPVYAALVVSDFIRIYFILGALLILAALILLEWRSRRWPHYRRLVFGIAAYSLNLIALILVTTMMVFAVISAANLLHPATVH